MNVNLVCSGSSLNMFVEDKACCKGPIPVSVSPNSTVFELKVLVQTEFEFPVGVQRWILDKTLADNDDATLASIGIQKSDQKIFLYLVAPGRLDVYYSAGNTWKTFFLFRLTKSSIISLPELAFPFLKVATTLVDLLFIDLMSHLSHIKHMYSQPLHLT